MDTVQFADGSSLIMSGSRGGDRGSGPPPPKCADQAEWKKAHSDQYLCCSHATTSILLMTQILCVAGRRVPLND